MSNEIFNDVSASIDSGSVNAWTNPRDCLLIGFNGDQILTDPVNTLEFTFGTPSASDCQLIIEYSAGGGKWYPLSFGIQGLSGGAASKGTIHFEPPADWTAMSTWDGSVEIGGGSIGSGPELYWLRIQRRNMDGTNAGAITGSVTASNRPWIIAKRNVDTLYWSYADANVGQDVQFKFVPVGLDGKEYPDRQVIVQHTIQGVA